MGGEQGEEEDRRMLLLREIEGKGWKEVIVRTKRKVRESNP